VDENLDRQQSRRAQPSELGRLCFAAAFNRGSLPGHQHFKPLDCPERKRFPGTLLVYLQTSPGTRQSLAETVSADVGYLAKAVEETQSQQGSGVNANTDISTASLDALQG
jgi:hypothetical protein